MEESIKKRFNIGKKPVITGIMSNILLVIFKGTFGVMGHSNALIADAIESLSDVFSSIVVFFGLKISSIPPDDNHPYGHGKAEPITASLVAFGLFFASIVIIYQSAHDMSSETVVPETYTIYVLLSILVIKELLYRYSHKVSKEINSNSLEADAWHHRSDAITSFIALFGVSISIAGGTKYAFFDDIAAIIAGIFVMYNAYKIFRRSLGQIMDETPNKEIINFIYKTSKSIKGVNSSEKCTIRKMGYYYIGELHIRVDGNISVKNGHDIAHIVEDRIKEGPFPIEDITIHVEPTRKS